MKFSQGKLEGVWTVELEAREDERGSLTKVFDLEQFSKHSLQTTWAQSLVSATKKTGTIRGMHWQADPAPEVKLIRCSRGRVFDVLVDIRPESETFGMWEAYELSGSDQKVLYVSKGLAHGFQTLEDDSELSYQISCPYQDQLQTGFRWDDREVCIEWPLPCFFASEKDISFSGLHSHFI